MKIAVCISLVPDTTSKIEFTEDLTQFNTQGIQFITNPNDEFGLSRAIFIKEEKGAHVDVINVGNANSDSELRKALAKGADEAIRINAEPKDSFFVASQLAKIVLEKKYDLVFTGRESIDYNGGMVHGIIAALTNYNYVTNCIGLEMEDTSCTAIREIDGGKEFLKTELPLVIGAQKGLVEEKDLKIPNMRGIMTARQKPLHVLEPDTSSAYTEDVLYEKPASKDEIKWIDASNLDELVEVLHKKLNVI